MIDLGYQPEVGDEFVDHSDGSKVRITSVDVWAREVGFTRTYPSQVAFHFEVIPEADFKTAVDTGFFKQIGSENLPQGACWHKWETYVGFSWTYKFCSKCDVRHT